MTLVMSGVTVSAGRTVILDQVDMSIQGGSLVGVVGPNGAGKSTLLRVAAGDRRPDRGRVELQGTPIDNLGPGELALRRAVLPQFVDPRVEFLVREVVEMGRYPHRRDPDNTAGRDRRLVETAMDQTDIVALADRVFSTLSGGEQVRTALARVLAQDAPVVLLDEPTAALDVLHQERTMRIARDLAANGTTVVAVLHDLNLAAAYADRILVVDGGEIRADGEPSSVLTGPLLSEVYRQPMRVVEHPFRPCPLVLVTDG